MLHACMHGLQQGRPWKLLMKDTGTSITPFSFFAVALQLFLYNTAQWLQTTCVTGED